MFYYVQVSVGIFVQEDLRVVSRAIIDVTVLGPVVPRVPVKILCFSIP